MSQPNLLPIVGAYVIWRSHGIVAEITKVDLDANSIWTKVVSADAKEDSYTFGYQVGAVLPLSVDGVWEPDFMISYDDPTGASVDPKLSYVDGAW